MTSSQHKASAVRLTDDGELIDAAPDTADMIYCTACGSKNQPDSNFCRTCGESLQDQAGRPARKSKAVRQALYEAEFQAKGDPGVMAFMGVLRLLIVGVLATIMATNMPFPSNFIVPAALIVFGLAADKIFK
jgi:hypothetical protein